MTIKDDIKWKIPRIKNIENAAQREALIKLLSKYESDKKKIGFIFITIYKAAITD